MESCPPLVQNKVPNLKGGRTTSKYTYKNLGEGPTKNGQGNGNYGNISYYFVLFPYF